jgi:hypothetical protein
MTVGQLIEKLGVAPESIDFDEVIDTISEYYQYLPTKFTNGVGDRALVNEAGSNEGSCKIFSFAKLNNLSDIETLACFGRFYRDDVLANLSGDDHANIRKFMEQGWSGLKFDNVALVNK